MAHIYHNFQVKSNATKIYDVITKLDGLKNWWTLDTSGNPEKNGELRFGFGGEMFNKMKVVQTEKNKFVEWKCIEALKIGLGQLYPLSLLKTKTKTPS